MSDPVLAAIQARVEKATRGPWKRRRWQGLDMVMTRFGCLFNTHSGFNDENDAEFIAHARTDIPYLLAALSEARSQALEEAAAAINAQCCHADERWDVQYTADDCQFCQPVMKAVRKLGKTQA